MKRLKKTIIGILIFFAVYTLFGFLILPPILKSVLARKLSENLHREVVIAQIKTNPYTLSLTVRGFQVKDREHPETFLSFDELFINLQSFSALRMALILKEIRLTQPYLRIHRQEDGSYNFADLLEKKETAPPEKPAEKTKPFRFSLNNIRIESGSIDFWDGPKKTRHTVKELNIGIPFLSNIPAHIDIFIQPNFSAKINETPYRLQGNTKPFRDTLETIFDIDIQDLDIPHYLAYFPVQLRFKIVSALLDVRAKVSFIQPREEQPTLTVTGTASLKKVALDDDKKKPLFRLPLLEIDIAPSEPLRKIIHLAKVSLQSPELEVKRSPEGVFNVEAFLPKKKGIPPSAPVTKKEEQDSLSIDIDEILLTGGKVSFSDLSRKKPFKTVLSPIELKVVPFSNVKDKKTNYSLAIATESKENIRLEGELFIEPLKAEGGVEIKSVPLLKYAPYYQDQILFNLEEGRLDVSARYHYAKGEKKPEISLSGISVILNALRLKRQEEKEDFLKIPVLSVKDTSVDVTRKKVTVGHFSTEKGGLTFTRMKNGELDLMKLLPPSGPVEAPPAKEAGKREETKWVAVLSKLSVDHYTVHMKDDSLSQPAVLTAEKVALRGENLSTGKNALGKLSLSFLLDQTGALSTQNTIGLDPLSIEGSLEIRRIVLNKYAPYYQDNLLFNIDGGDLDFSTHYQYRKTDRDPLARVTGLSASLTKLKLKKKGEQETFLDIPALAIKNTGLDLNQKEVSVGEVSTQKGTLIVRRFKNGKINLQSLFPEAEKKEEKTAGPSLSKKSEKGKMAEKPWLIKLGKASVDDYNINVEDHAPAEPVALVMDELRLRGERFSTAQGQKGNAALSFRFNQKGALSTEGAVGINPLSANLKVNVKEVGVKPLQAYFTERVKVNVTDGAVSTAGNLLLEFSDKKELKTTYHGKASLTRFASIDRQHAADLLKVESLALEDLRFSSDPFSLDIKGISLSDFYAHVIIHPDGALNLQQLTGKEEIQQEAPPSKESPPVSSAGKKEAQPAKTIKIETVTLQGGRIDFSDRSIQPDYSAKLTEIGGRISGLSSEETTLADLELRAKLDDYAPLEITGKINPLKEDLYVDLKARFKDMELSPMTPYAGKYVGYSVEKGKLSFDLKYLIQRRKLESQNQIFLDQFNLGEKVDSPHATKLPVKLAISLLKDRKGEIKLDIPVTGSLDDPKFSVWGIILKILVNLIAKAATSPFSLLGAIMGGGEELSFVEFEHGSAALTEPNVKKLEAVAKALNNRPQLKMDIEGYADPEKDREALKRLFFNRKLKAQKLKEMVKKGQPPVPVDEVNIEKQEYEKYLKLAYKEEKFPKPRNVLGMAKDIPAPEMEKLILTHLEIRESDLRALANQRAMKVKEAIVTSGPVGAERIFILEPRSLAPAKKENLKESRVDFKLKS